MSEQVMAQARAQTAQIKPASGLLRRAAITPVAHGVLQRCSNGVECPECRQKRVEREGTLQRAAVNAAPTAVPPIVHDVLSSPGQPLDAGTRAFMEPRFGHDFSGVRVHTDARAAESARAVSALAYTVGRNVVFGMGQYAPGTSEGRRLMAHELTHVVQQRESTSRVQTSLIVGSATDQSELQAEQVANSVISGKSVDVVSKAVTSTALQRVVDPCPDVPTPHVLLVWGSKNPAVGEGQRKLNQFDAQEKASGRLGLKGAPLVVDCKFGPLTHNATVSFQEKAFPGMPWEYDGKIGDHTWKELDKIPSLPSPTPPSPLPAPTLPVCPIGGAAPLLRDPHIPSHALCRGACGPDCPTTCTSQPNVKLCVPDATGSSHIECEYTNVIKCGSHLGCREHDACYDACAVTGEHNLCYLGGTCHCACDYQCIDHFDISRCNSWRKGGGPFDSMLRFSDPPVPTGPFPGSCTP